MANKHLLDFLVSLHIGTLMMALCADNDTQALCLCLTGSGNHGTIALRVYADGLLEE